MTKKYRETLHNGEAFALKQMPAADIMSLLCADAVPPNEEIDGGVVVHVRGPLEHHSTPFCDNYDDLYSRFCKAIHCAKEKGWCVVVKIDSPGGLVSGLNETVYAMQEEAREHAVDVIVYVDELAASAAYAISCAGDEIVVPPSGIVGSVGVISAMTSVSRANEKAGVDVVTITSGKRKADGHPDVPIDDDAIKAEQERVNDLAGQFFALVEESRGIDAKEYEAGLFLGKKAVKAGLADRVANWPQLLVDIAADYGSGTEVAQDGTAPSRATGDPMNLKALVTRAEKALAAEKDPKKRQALMADLVAFRSALQAGTKKTYKKMEEQRTEESDDKDEEAEGGNETDREEEDETPEKDDDKKESKKKASAHRAESEEEESAESEEEEASAESEEEEASAEDDKDEEEALASLVGALKGPRAQRALGALAALRADAKRGRVADGRVARLEAKLATDALHATIDARKAQRHITASEAKWLKTQPRATVESFLKTRKSPIFLTEDDAHVPPHAGSGINPHAAQAGELGPQQMAVLQKVADGAGVPIETLVKQYKPVTPNGIKLGGN